MSLFYPREQLVMSTKLTYAVSPKEKNRNRNFFAKRCMKTQLTYRNLELASITLRGDSRDSDRSYNSQRSSTKRSTIGTPRGHNTSM